MISANINLFCCEDISKIENYDKAIADETQTWHCHHRLEIQGDKRILAKELIKQNLYFNRPASELIFLTTREHRSIHMKGRVVDEDVRKKISDSVKKYQRENPISEERHKKMSHIQRAMKFYNNGKISTKGLECPEGFVPGRLKFETRGSRGMHWYTDGKIQILCFEEDCPEGFNKGKLPYSEEHNKNVSKGRKLALKNESYLEKLRIAAKGRKRYTNGKINIMIFGECPEGFWPGMTKIKRTRQNE